MRITIDPTPPKTAWPGRLSAFHAAKKLERRLKNALLSITISSAMMYIVRDRVEDLQPPGIQPKSG